MKSWWSSLWPPLVAVLFFLTVWQAAVWMFDIEPFILPSPTSIGLEAASGAAGLMEHTLATLQLTLIGFMIGTTIGLILSLALHIVPVLKTALYPLLILSQNVPVIALAPLLMIWFGFGLVPKVIVISLVCFFPVAVAALDGLTRTDRAMMNYMKMTGANTWQIFTKLELPHALPSIFSGIRIAATYSVMGAVIGEWIGSDKGIGYYMMLQKSGYRTDRVFVAILVIVLLSLLMVALITLLEKRLIRWNRQAADE